MSVFFLVHGSWHDGGVCGEVMHQRESRGCQAFAPTVTRYDNQTNREVTHAECKKSVVEFIAAELLSDFVLLSHSFGRMLISKVAEAIPGKIRRLVYQNGFFVRDGHSVLDDSPSPIAAFFEKMAAELADNSFLLPFPVWRDTVIRMSNRLGLYRLVQTPGSHELMPSGLAEKIVEAGRD